MATDGKPVIVGYTAPEWTSLRDAFARSFSEYGETGATFVVYHHGVRVVDLAGGVADDTGRPYTPTTIQQIFSATKVFSPIACMILEERGLLDIEQPVAKYWPEFGQNGKEHITVRQVLSHTAGCQRDNVATFYEQQTVDRFAEAIARAPAVSVPEGYTSAYHGFTMGVIIGTVVQRITGLTPNAFFQKEVAEKLSIDFTIGMQPWDVARAARFVIPPPDFTKPAILAWVMRSMGNPTSEWQKVMCGGYDTKPAADAAEMMKKHNNPTALIGNENASLAGFTNARGLARVYAALVSEIDGMRLVKLETLNKYTKIVADGRDLTLEWDCAWGIGFMVGTAPAPDTMEPVALLWDRTFYCPGAGGQLGLGDAEHEIAIGFTSRQFARQQSDPKAISLIETVKARVEELSTLK